MRKVRISSDFKGDAKSVPNLLWVFTFSSTKQNNKTRRKQTNKQQRKHPDDLIQ